MKTSFDIEKDTLVDFHVRLLKEILGRGPKQDEDRFNAEYPIKMGVFCMIHLS